MIDATYKVTSKFSFTSQANIMGKTDNSPSFDNSNSFIVPHWYMYPPKGLYTESNELMPSFEKALNAITGKINIYVHIPFCNMRCSFCTLFTTPEKNDLIIGDYVTFLLKELEIIKSNLSRKDMEVINLYFGGGTPSILSHFHINKIVTELKRKFSFSSSSTLSVEFSPESSSLQTCINWRTLGFNRVSIGIQSFNIDLLKSMNRSQTYVRCRQSIDELIKAGFKNINIDLIYGYTGQSEEDFVSDLQTAILSGANSITLHPLAYRRKTGYSIINRKPQTFDYELEHYEMLYQAALDFFESKSWVITSAVSFSSNNEGHPIEEAEANGIPTIGIGAGARTYLPDLHTSSIRYESKEVFKNTMSDYFNYLSNERLPVVSYYALDLEDRVRRQIVLSIVGRGIQEGLINNISQPELQSELHGLLKQLIELGFVAVKEGTYSLTKKGLQNASFIGAYLSRPNVQEIIGFR